MRKVSLVGLCAGMLLVSSCQQLRRVTPSDVLEVPVSSPDVIVPYGSHPRQIGHLRLPAGNGPYPVAVLVHGGCWLSQGDLRSMSPIADDLTRLGFATWNIEYRPVDEGGAWPNAFLDVAAAFDALREIANAHRLDLAQVIAVGHSAGGHFATWAAGRHRIRPESPLYRRDPLPLRGTLSLAGPGDLAPIRAVDRKVCGVPVIDRLMGGSPKQVPEHYAAGSPKELLPIGVPLRFLTGSADRVVPPTWARDFARSARAAGDDASSDTVHFAEHFDPILPRSSAWIRARAIVLSLIDPMAPTTSALEPGDTTGASSSTLMRVYAVQSGQTALDKARHRRGNPFADAVVELLARPSVALGEWPRRLQRRTARLSRGRMQPDWPGPVIHPEWVPARGHRGERRVAFVIVYSDYRRVGTQTLLGAAHDAERMGKALESAGFQTTVVIDPTSSEVFALGRHIYAVTSEADAAFLYTTGHSVEVDGALLLLRSDAPPDGERQGYGEGRLRFSEMASWLRAKSVNLALFAGCRSKISMASDLDAGRGTPHTSREDARELRRRGGSPEQPNLAL